MLRLIVLICILLLGSVDRAWAEAPRATAGDTIEVPSSPRGALLRSMVLPGWGQFYNGRPIKGSLFAAAEAGSVVAFFVRRNQLNEGTAPGIEPQRNVYLFSSIGIVLLSMADAYVDAHLDSVDWGEVDLGPGDSGELKMVVRVRF